MSNPNQSLNYLIGNFVSETGGDDKTIKSNQMISIDTSNGFLGFNTIDPSFNIDVCNGTIRTNTLILNKLENIPTIDNDNTINDDVPFLVNTIYRTANGTLKIKF